MSRIESIIAALAFLTSFAFENKFSPSFVISFLKKYCVDSTSEYFVYYYKISAQSNNIDISDALFYDDDLSVELDIAKYAETQSSYDNITYDMPFKESYLSKWNSAFS